MSDSLWPHESQQARPPCPSPTNSRSLFKLLSIESVTPPNHLILCRPLLLPPSIFPSIKVFSNESFLYIRWPKYWVSSLASVLPVNIQDWFPLGWTGWISCSPKDSQASSPTTQFKSINSLVLSFFYGSTLIGNTYMTTGKTIALTRWTFVGKVMSLILICCLGLS